jgi:uncharacterized protein YhaN
MFLVELVLQGVRGFREHARLRFKGGFNLVAAGNESGKTTAIDSVQRLLFPSDRAELFEAFVSRYAPDTSRAALVTCSDEGAYNRMIQDFSKRAVNLSQYNPTSKDFSILHRDWNNAVQFMAGMTAGTSEEDFARIFIFRREHYATGSRQSAPVPASKAAPAMPAPPEKGRSSTNKERLAELREILRKAEEAADAEYRFESAKLAREEITKKIDSLDEIKQQKTAIQSTLESLKMYEAMPENLIELIDDQEKRQGQKLVDADELNKQIEGMKMQLAEMPTVNFIMDKLFISGVLMVIASIIAGVFVLTDELRILFPVGLVLALILMVGAWYKESRLGTRRKNITKEEEKLKAELNKLETLFLQKGATVTTLMRSTAASSLADLKEKSANYRSALSFRDDIEEQETRSLGDKTLESLLQQQEEMQQEVTKLEQAAQAVAEYNVDTYSIRQEIELMDSSTSIASAGEAWDFGAESQEQVPIAPNVISSDQGGGFLDDLAIACRIAGIEMETLVPSVEAAAQRNLASITEGKYVKIEAGRESGPVVHDKDNSIVDHSELSHGTRNLITFCLRAGLVEALAGKRRFPFLLDDPFADFDPARQKAACQILRSLGAKTQVILFTSDPALTAEGDTVVEFQ